VGSVALAADGGQRYRATLPAEAAGVVDGSRPGPSGAGFYDGLSQTGSVRGEHAVGVFGRRRHEKKEQRRARCSREAGGASSALVVKPGRAAKRKRLEAQMPTRGAVAGAGRARCTAIGSKVRNEEHRQAERSARSWPAERRPRGPNRGLLKRSQAAACEAADRARALPPGSVELAGGLDVRLDGPASHERGIFVFVGEAVRPTPACCFGDRIIAWRDLVRLG